MRICPKDLAMLPYWQSESSTVLKLGWKLLGKGWWVKSKNNVFRRNIFSFRSKIVASVESLHAAVKKSVHPQRIIVWCGFKSCHLVIKFSFECDERATVTANSERYRAMETDSYRFTDLLKLKLKTSTTFGLKKTVLMAIQSFPQSIFCIQSSKIEQRAKIMMWTARKNCRSKSDLN